MNSFEATLCKGGLVLWACSPMTRARLNIGTIAIGFNDETTTSSHLCIKITLKNVNEKSITEDIIATFSSMDNNNKDLFQKAIKIHFILGKEEIYTFNTKKLTDITHEKVIKWISDFLDAFTTHVPQKEPLMTKIHKHLEKEGFKLGTSNIPFEGLSAHSFFASNASADDANEYTLGDNNSLNPNR